MIDDWSMVVGEIGGTESAEWGQVVDHATRGRSVAFTSPTQQLQQQSSHQQQTTKKPLASSAISEGDENEDDNEPLKYGDHLTHLFDLVNTQVITGLIVVKRVHAYLKKLVAAKDSFATEMIKVSLVDG